MPRVVHFELPSQDPARSARFYADVFGWKFHKWDGGGGSNCEENGQIEYWLAETGDKTLPGIDGGLSKSDPIFPANAPICTIDVPSVDDFAAKIEAAGGSILIPKMPIPGVGYLAYCKDTEGVIFGMMQPDPSAAPSN